MVVAFDFDGVVSNPSVQGLVKKFISEKNVVYIVTMRRDNKYNNELIEPFLKRINLTKHNVMFCDNKPKIEVLLMLDADIYIDNISVEFENILRQTNIIPLLFINY